LTHTTVQTIGDGTYWLRIVGNGGSLSVDYSYDGNQYSNAFSASLADPSGTYNELLLGGITYSGAGSFADYSFVAITDPSSIPEPATQIMIGSALLILPLLRVAKRRRNRA
jgi:hypothetical protein